MDSAVLTPAHRSLLQAALGAVGGAPVAYDAWRRTVAFEDVDDEAYRLLPMLSRTLDAAGIVDDLTPRLHGVHRRTWYANQIALRTAREAVSRLHAAGIATRVLGGPLSILHYRDDRGGYPFDSLDLLAAPAQHEAALAALHGLGWRSINSRQDVRVLEHQRSGFLALHGRVAHGLLADAGRAASDHVWRRPTSVSLLGPNAYVISPEAHLLFLAEYRMTDAGVRALRVLTEASVLLAREAALDWQDLAVQARLQQAGAPLARLLAALEEATGQRPPPGFIEQVTAPAPPVIRARETGLRPAARRAAGMLWRAAGMARRAFRSARVR